MFDACGVQCCFFDLGRLSGVFGLLAQFSFPGLDGCVNAFQSAGKYFLLVLSIGLPNSPELISLVIASIMSVRSLFVRKLASMLSVVRVFAVTKGSFRGTERCMRLTLSY